MFDRPDTAALRQRLLAAQRHFPSVEGLMIVSYGGIISASTFHDPDSSQRLAAIARTLYLLAEETSIGTGRGLLQSVRLRYKPRPNAEHTATSDVVLSPIGDEFVLLMALSGGPATPDVEHMVGYMVHQIVHEAR